MSNLGFSNADLQLGYFIQSTLAAFPVVHVNGATEFTYIDDNRPIFSLDVSDTTLTITFLIDRHFDQSQANPFDGITLTDTTNNVVALQGGSVVSTDVTGFGLVVSPDSVQVNWQGTTVHVNDKIVLHFTFADIPPEAMPTASDAAVSTYEDTSLIGTVPAGSGNGPLHYGLDSISNPGLNFDFDDGSYTFDPDGDFENLGVGQHATFTFGYHAIDAVGARSDTHTVTITINGVNDAPVLDPAGVSLTPGLATGEAVSVFLSGIGDVDANSSQGLAITAAGGTGTWEYSLNAGGSWTSFIASDGAALLLDGSDYIRFTPTAVTVATLTYHAWDEFAGTAGDTADLTTQAATGGNTAFSTGTATGTIGFNGANTPPVANPDTGNGAENGTTSFDVLANDADGDPLDTPTLVSLGSVTVTSGNPTVNGITPPSGVLAIVAGQVQFNPGTLFDALAAGETASVVVGYTMQDSAGATSSSTLTITVQGANDVPLIGGIVAASVTEDIGLSSGDLTAGGALTIADADSGQSAFVAVPSVTGTGHGTFTLDTAGNWTYAVDNSLAAIQGLGAGTTATDSFTAVSQDGSASQLITVTIHGSNDAPTAVADTASTGENTAAPFDVVANDTDADSGDTKSITGLGAISVSGLPGVDASPAFSFTTGAIQFNPGSLFDALAFGQSAVVTVHYTMQDGQHVASGSTLTVTVNGVNDAPVAQADTGTAGENEAKSFSVLANDLDVDSGDTKTVTSLGAISVSGLTGVDASSAFSFSASAIQFTPGSLFDALRLGQSATVTVHYTMEDGQHASSSSTLTLTVTGENDAPVAQPDTGTASENTSNSFTVLANDLDTDSGDTKAVTGLGAISVSGLPGVDVSSAFSFTTSAIQFNPGSLFDGLAFGQSAIVTVHYTMEDGQHVASGSTLTVTVNGVNDAPVAQADTGTAGENEAKSFSVLANDLDVDSGDTKTVTSLGAISVSGLTGIDASSAFSFSASAIQFTPGSLFDALRLGQSATVTVHYTMEDGRHASSNSTLTLTVTGENDAPVAQTDTGTASENTATSFTVLANDLDADSGDTKSITGLGAISVSGLPGVDASPAFAFTTSAIQFNPGSLFDALAFGQSAVVTVHYTMQDGQHVASGSTLAVTVNGVNDAPVAVADVGTAGENETKSFSVLANDVDVDSGDTKAITGFGAISVVGLTGINASPAFSFSASAVQFTPGSLFDALGVGQSATVTVHYTMADSQHAAASSVLTLTVNGANDAPVAVADTASAGYNQTKSFDVLANDVDVDSGDIKTLTQLGTITVSSSDLSIDGKDVSSAFSISQNGIAFDPGLLFAGLASGVTATVTVNYAVADRAAATSSSTLKLTVNGINQAPVIAGGGATAFTIKENGTAVGTITASDPDAGNVLHFAIVGGVAGGPDAALFAIDPNSGVLGFVSAPDFEAPADADRNNVYQVVVQVSDGQDTDTQTVDVTVGNITGVRIVGGKANDMVNSARSVHGQAMPTNEEDTLIGANGNDKLWALGGNDLVSGGKGNDLLYGDVGDDVLIGGVGNNRLVGGAGHDMFVFDSELSNSMGHAYNFSTISDFSAVDDTIALKHTIFKGIKPGVLSGAAYFAGAGPHDTSDRIIYNPKNGVLIYDQDGSGFLNGIEFGKIAAHLHVSHFDFLIV